MAWLSTPAWSGCSEGSAEAMERDASQLPQQKSVDAERETEKGIA